MIKPSQVDQKSFSILLFFIKSIENPTENIDLSSKSDFKFISFFCIFRYIGLLVYENQHLKTPLTNEKLFNVYEFDFVFELLNCIPMIRFQNRIRYAPECAPKVQN